VRRTFEPESSKEFDMPLPMVHLAVAVKMYGVEGNGDFLLGNLSPDAIHMRPHTKFEDKLHVHLTDIPEQRFERVRQLLAGDRSGDDAHEVGFVEGYVTHLLTDFLWREIVIAPFHQQVPTTLAPREKRKLYYRETDQNDFDLYHHTPWQGAVWAALSQTIPTDFKPFLTCGEITQWRDRVLKWFDDTGKEPKIEPVYISYEETLRFIERAAAEIKSVLEDWKAFRD
jgi:hypothetical protein